MEGRAAGRLYFLVLLLVGGGGAREDLGVDADADAEARGGEARRGGAGGVVFKMGIRTRPRVRGLAGAGTARYRFSDAAVGAVVASARLGRAADDAARAERRLEAPARRGGVVEAPLSAPPPRLKSQ